MGKNIYDVVLESQNEDKNINLNYEFFILKLILKILLKLFQQNQLLKKLFYSC